MYTLRPSFPKLNNSNGASDMALQHMLLISMIEEAASWDSSKSALTALGIQNGT
jgi:hypothetical protein